MNMHLPGSNKEPEPVPSARGLGATGACPSSATADDPQLCQLPPLLSPPLRVVLLACSLDASPCAPAVILYYSTFLGSNCKIQKGFIFLFVFVYVLLV